MGLIDPDVLREVPAREVVTFNREYQELLMDLIDEDILTLFQKRWPDVRYWPVPQILELQKIRTLKALTAAMREKHTG